MTKEEIIEGNKLIAAFLVPNWEELEDDGYNGTIDSKNLYIAAALCSNELDLLHYHRSWSSLMPVLEKISKIEYERWEDELPDGSKEIVIETAYPRTFGILHNNKPMVRINRCPVFEAETLIEAAWLAIVDFVKWRSQEIKHPPIEES